MYANSKISFLLEIQSGVETDKGTDGSRTKVPERRQNINHLILEILILDVLCREWSITL